MNALWRTIRRILIVVLVVLAYAPSLAAQRVHVRGYTRRNGTYVAPHTRAATGAARSSAPAYITPRPPRESRVKTETQFAPTKAPPFAASGPRDFPGRIERSESAKRQFMQRTGFPHGRPGYVIDHIRPLACGGADAPSNMQWQTVAEGRAKDKTERIGCGLRGGRR